MEWISFVIEVLGKEIKTLKKDIDEKSGMIEWYRSRYSELSQKYEELEKKVKELESHE